MTAVQDRKQAYPRPRGHILHTYTSTITKIPYIRSLKVQEVRSATFAEQNMGGQSHMTL